jgi:N-acylneuraminate cytidylyltransferase
VDAIDVLAVIIGRAGSRGLPGKNARILAGRPMIAHTIEDATRAAAVDAVVVSTDCPRVAEAARRLDVTVIDRPEELAGDDATVDDAARHAVTASGLDAPIVVILYANVPLRPDDLIDRAVTRLRASGADSVQSYAPVGKHHPYWMVTLDDTGAVRPHVENEIYRRQDLPPLLLPDGGVIAVTRRSLFAAVPGRPHSFLGADRRGITAPAGAVVDIDEPIDLLVAEARLGHRAAAGSAS